MSACQAPANTDYIAQHFVLDQMIYVAWLSMWLSLSLTLSLYLSIFISLSTHTHPHAHTKQLFSSLNNIYSGKVVCP